MVNLQIQKAGISQAETLLAFSKQTFYDFFAHLNEPANMEAYSATAFTLQSMQEQINNPDSEFYLAMEDATLIGYVKLNFKSAQTEFQDNNSLEVERIYVAKGHHGKHIGHQLMDLAMGIAREKNLQYVWLGVWEHNQKAIGFYEQNGFKLFGSHEFVLGDDVQTDLLMKKEL